MTAVLSVTRHVALAASLALCAFSAAAEDPPTNHGVAPVDEGNPDPLIMPSAWRDLVAMLHERALVPVDEDAMRRACLRAQGSVSTGLSTADACLTAAVAAVDPRASYHSREKTAELREDAPAAPVGIGLEVAASRQPGSDLTIVSPIVGAPAERAGVRSGDRIVRIDGQDVRPLTTHQAMMKLRGEPGSEVSLELARGADREKISLLIRRVRIHVKSVRREPGQGNVAALRIARFDDGTVSEFMDCVHQILNSAHPLPAVLLVDLRMNPGGTLNVVRRVAGLFSGRPDTVVAISADRTGSRELTVGAVESPESGGLSLAEREWLASLQIDVLVDRGTGSGAELLAQFLREDRHARIVGSRTLGMAYINDTIVLTSGASITMPIGELASPRGSSWQDGGIVPDVRLAATSYAEFGSERDVQFHDALQALQSR